MAATGRYGSINAHSASVTSKRATTEFYQPSPARQQAHRDPNPKQLLGAGTGYPTLDDALHRLVDLDMADMDDDPERDRIPLRHAYSLMSAIISAVRSDPSGFDLDAVAEAARHTANYDPLLVEAVKLLVEVTGEEGVIEACDRLTDRPVAAASVAEDIRAAALRRDWIGEPAPRVARRLHDRGDLAGGLAAVALSRLGVSVGFAEPYGGLVRSLRAHPVADVRDAAYAVRLSDR